MARALAVQKVWDAERRRTKPEQEVELIRLRNAELLQAWQKDRLPEREARQARAEERRLEREALQARQARNTTLLAERQAAQATFAQGAQALREAHNLAFAQAGLEDRCQHFSQCARRGYVIPGRGKKVLCDTHHEEAWAAGAAERTKTCAQRAQAKLRDDKKKAQPMASHRPTSGP